MDIQRKAIEIIKEAERALQVLLRDAIAAGQYDSLGQVAEWAKLLASLQGPNAPVESARATTELGAAPSKRPAKSKSKKTYPKFFRDGEHVVKVAWSKAAKAEYEHKATWSVIESLVAELKIASARSKLVSMDSILPIKTKLGEEVPGYQVYVGLAWLRDAGVVEAIGRKGYALKKTSDILGEVKGCFDRLAKRYS